MIDAEQVTQELLRGLYVNAEARLTLQTRKWGIQDHTPGNWWLIVSEEFGELAKAALEGNESGIVNAAADLFGCIARFVEKVTRTDAEEQAWQIW